MVTTLAGSRQPGNAACQDRLVGPTALSPALRRLLAEVAARVPQRDDSSDDCVRVAVDGVDGAGKTTFADLFAEQLRSTGREVVRVSADDFHHRRAVRHQRGRNSPPGFWLDTYDYVALRKVLDPLGPAGSRRYQTAAYDLDFDQALDPPWCEAPPGAVLILDGMFLHRDELADCWDLSIFLQVPFSVSVARLASRDGSNPDPEHPSLARYVQGQRLYFAACSPWDRADLVVDYADLDAPSLIDTR